VIEFDLQRVTIRCIAGMLCAAIAAGAGRQGAQQIDFGEKFDKIAGAHRACFHEILMRVMGEARAHENVEHIMDMRLGLDQRESGFSGQSPGQIRMAAMVIIASVQQTFGVGIAARADNVMHPAAVRIEAVPVECVMGYRRHRPHMGKTAPHPVAGAQVRAMQSAGLSAVKSFRQVVLRPEVQIAHLRAVHADDPEKTPRRYTESPGVARRHDRLTRQFHCSTRGGILAHVRQRQGIGGIADHGFDRLESVGINRRFIFGGSFHALYFPGLDVAGKGNGRLPIPFPK
jgi:hypothetical protein